MADSVQENIEQIIANLTPKELRFCQLYAQCLNGAKAARDAGYSENTAKVIACENLTKPNLKQVVKHYLELEAMSTEEAVKRISDMGRGNFEYFVKEDGTVDLTTDSAKANIGLIKKVKQTKKIGYDGTEIVSTEIEIHDAKDALKTILEVHGKLVQKHEVYIPPTIVL